MPDQLRITLVSSQPGWGGGEQWLWSLGRGIAQRGCRVSWIAPAGSGLAARVAGIHEPLLTTRGRGTRAGDLWNVRKFLRRHSPQILQLNDSHSVFWTSMAGLGTPATVRLAVKHTIFPIRFAIKYRLLVDRVICVSKAAQAACISAGLSVDRTWQVYAGVEPPQGQAGDRAWALDTLDWPKDTCLVAAVGGLQECKGHRFLIEAMSQLVPRMPHVRVAIAGEGDQRGELETLIAKYGLANHVRLLGFRQDPTRWLSAADVVVQPSLAEALSLVAVEAQLLGKPLVATAVGGLSEVIQADAPEPLAWVAKPHDANDLAKNLERAIARDEAVLNRCAAARSAAHSRFGMDRFINEMLGYYRGHLIRRKAA